MQGFIRPSYCTPSLITIRRPWWEPSDMFPFSLLPFFIAIFFFVSPTSLRCNLCVIPFFFFSPPSLSLLLPAPGPYLHLIACNGGRLRRQIGAIQYSSIWAELLICPIHRRPALIGLMVREGVGMRCSNLLRGLWSYSSPSYSWVGSRFRQTWSINIFVLLLLPAHQLQRQASILLCISALVLLSFLFSFCCYKMTVMITPLLRAKNTTTVLFQSHS